MTDRLTMREYLGAVRAFQVHSREYLLERGYHHRVITAKAEKAARKGYTDYGVVADRPWLTEAGRAFLEPDNG